jgi:hypothetical protein
MGKHDMKLIDESRHWWRMWSNRLALFAGMAAAALVADPGLLAQFVAMVPEQWRPAAAAVVGLLVSTSAIGARMAKQDKLRPEGEV